MQALIAYQMYIACATEAENDELDQVVIKKLNTFAQ